MFSVQIYIQQIVNKSVCCIFKIFTSYLFLLFAFLTTAPQPGEQHFEPGLDVCILASICNHTNNPECGKERKDLDKRMFLDECDMIEYNCDNRKDYFIIPHEECDPEHTKETMKDLSTKELHTSSTDQHSGMITTNDFKSESSIISTLSRSSITNNEKPKKTTVTFTKPQNLTTTIKISSEHIQSNAGVCTCGAKNKHILTTAVQKTISTTEHTSTTKIATKTDKTTYITKSSLQDKTIQQGKTTQQDKTTSLSQINTVTRNCTRKRTIPISSIPKKPYTSILTTLYSIKTTINNINFSSSLLTDTTIFPFLSGIVTNKTSEMTEKNNTTENTAPTTELTSTSKDKIATTHVTSKSTAVTKKTSRKTKPAAKLTSKNAGKTSPCGTKAYPKDCNRPLTWETTAKGETRDFYQILRARFGDRLKTLKGTTHWPRRRNYYRGNYNFFASRHNEG